MAPVVRRIDSISAIDDAKSPVGARSTNRPGRSSVLRRLGDRPRREDVFAELNATKPDTVSYIVLRLADDSFLHVSFHSHGDDEVNPIASTAAFAHFQQDHADRREGGVDQQTARLVGAYVTTIE
jgi:hypothetical protein